jgi:hypothetical protein
MLKRSFLMLLLLVNGQEGRDVILLGSQLVLELCDAREVGEIAET